MSTHTLKRIVMNIICTLLTVSLILLTCACSMKKNPPASAAEVLSAMLKEIDPPHGQIRSLTAEKETEKIPPDLLVALYGSTAGKWYGAIVDDGAVYLSEVMHPFEIAVFRCVDERDVRGGIASVLGVCSTRLDTIKSTWQGSDYEPLVQNAVVTYCNGYVLLVVAEDPETMIRAATKIIKSY